MPVEFLINEVKKIKEKRELSYRKMASESFIPLPTLHRYLQSRPALISEKNIDRLNKFYQKWRHIINEDTDG